MAVETLCHAMYSRLKLCEISFVTIETGVVLLHVIRIKIDWQAGEKQAKEADEPFHGNAQYSEYYWRENARSIV
jgi:hypothetical protein